MRKLYLISNYNKALYELNENNECIVINKDEEPKMISIEKAIEKFQNIETVKIYGVIHAFIQKRKDWKETNENGEEVEKFQWFIEKDLFEEKRLIENAKLLSKKMHSLQKYGVHPYYKHLQDVVNVLKKFGYTQSYYVISGWLHDVLEDSYLSYNDIKESFGEKIADIVYCVTDELGKNRRERKEKTYPKIKSNHDAIIIKLADRIANFEHGIKIKDYNFAKLYAKEHKEFKEKLYIEGHASKMWEYLDKTILENDSLTKARIIPSVPKEDRSQLNEGIN